MGLRPQNRRHRRAPPSGSALLTIGRDVGALVREVENLPNEFARQLPPSLYQATREVQRLMDDLGAWTEEVAAPRFPGDPAVLLQELVPLLTEVGRVVTTLVGDLQGVMLMPGTAEASPSWLGPAAPKHPGSTVGIASSAEGLPRAAAPSRPVVQPTRSVSPEPVPATASDPRRGRGGFPAEAPRTPSVRFDPNLPADMPPSLGQTVLPR